MTTTDYLTTVPADYVVAEAQVMRYVNTQEPAGRGYDLAVLADFAGDPQEISFLRVLQPIAGISPGDRVLVIARQVEAPPSATVVVPDGQCPALQYLGEIPGAD